MGEAEGHSSVCSLARIYPVIVYIHSLREEVDCCLEVLQTDSAGDPPSVACFIPAATL